MNRRDAECAEKGKREKGDVEMEDERMSELVYEVAPGSEKAIEEGCTCPVMDNHYGRGEVYEGQVVYWINEDCPLHGVPVEARGREW